MKLRPSSYFLIFLLVVAVVFLVSAVRYPQIHDRLLGMVAATIMMAAGIPQLISELKTTRRASRTEEEPERKKETATFLRRFGLALSWTVGFAIATYILGLLISIPLFIISYLKWQHTRWWVAITVAIVTIAVIYIFFEVVLVRPLWRGILPIPWWLIPFL